NTKKARPCAAGDWISQFPALASPPSFQPATVTSPGRPHNSPPAAGVLDTDTQPSLDFPVQDGSGAAAGLDGFTSRVPAKPQLIPGGLEPQSADPADQVEPVSTAVRETGGLVQTAWWGIICAPWGM